ncbi:unnamed protein product [Heligmosomoides polygyrus]|uniref:Uncharacterized protein n=1 Tax=Heligmosomoides polygyrus TaxID=6339 RepID=A0A183GNK2_HELPZ|nr:unnamed protein product [Heligmosomoides polygyrus]
MAAAGASCHEDVLAQPRLDERPLSSTITINAISPIEAQTDTLASPSLLARINHVTCVQGVGCKRLPA